MHPVVYSINEIILKNHQDKQIKLSAFLMGSLYPCMMDWMSRVGRMQRNVKWVLGSVVMHDSVVIWAADNYYTMSDLTFL
jgi:hypothetical protein